MRSDVLNACINGKYSSVQWLIENERISINEMNKYCKTTLLYACEKGYLSIDEYLISNGANANAKDKFGYYVIQYASKGGHYVIQYA